jgi:hypothetical protein
MVTPAGWDLAGTVSGIEGEPNSVDNVVLRMVQGREAVDQRKAKPSPR